MYQSESLQQVSVFHLYSTTLHKTMSQGIIVATYPECGVGNDPEPLRVAFLQALHLH